MTDSRISHEIDRGEARLISSRLMSVVLAVSCFAFYGCLAQQADLRKMREDLRVQIDQLKQEKKELQAEVDRAREAINEGEKQTAELKAETKKLFRSRADINQQFRVLREKDLAEMTGEIEVVSKQLADLQLELQATNTQTDSRIQGVETQIGARVQELETKVTTLQEHLTAHQQKTNDFIHYVDEDRTTLTKNMSDFQTAMAAFKGSLGDLGEKFVQEAERDSRVETQLNQQFAQNSLQTNTALGEMQTQLDTNKANIDEVSQSVTALTAALGESGTLLGSRLDEHADRVTLLETKQGQLEGDIKTLTEKLNMDTQALKTYLEQDVQSSMNTMVVSMQDQQLPLVQRVDALQGEVQGLGTELQTQSSQIQELTQSAVQLREHQDVMGSLLGKRGDDLIQHAGQLDARLNDLESHQTLLDRAVETNRQHTNRHFDELSTSLTSMGQALEKTSGDLATRLNSHEQALNDLTEQIQGLQALKGEVENSQSQIQSALQSSSEFRASVEQVMNRLNDLENHQSNMTAKLDGDVQTINTHLTKVNSAIASEKEAVAKDYTQLNSRIDEQERHLNQALTRFQAVQGVKETSQKNRAYLNQLTETVNKLREVLTTIGQKFGERVDQHEERLAELAKRINYLQAKKPKKEKK